MIVNQAVIDKMVEACKAALEDQMNEIDAAWIAAKRKLSIPLKVKLEAKEGGVDGFNIAVKIRFATDWVDDEVNVTIESGLGQQGLFDPKRDPELEAQQDGKVHKIFDSAESTADDNLGPNDQGVFENIPPTFLYEQKKSKASITIMKWEGLWLHASEGYIRLGPGYVDPLRIDHEKYQTGEDALDAAKQRLIGFCEETIKAHPAMKPEAKKIILWAEGLEVPEELKAAAVSGERAA
jgi:hypothetical protein